MRVIDHKTLEFKDDFERKTNEFIISDWMDEMEIKYIDEYKTYENGLNYTRGGSGTWFMREAAEKRRIINFRDSYMPMFRDHFQQHKNLINIPTRLNWGH